MSKQMKNHCLLLLLTIIPSSLLIFLIQGSFASSLIFSHAHQERILITNEAGEGVDLFLPIIHKPQLPPQIITFTANVDIADPGDTIELMWETENATAVTIYHQFPNGQIEEFWNVDASGTMTHTINEGRRNSDWFSIFASNDAFPDTSASLIIPLTCPFDWFFTPAPDVCAQEAAIISAGAEQQFEHGIMLWVEAEDRIYVLYDEDQYSNRWDIFTDDWDPGDPVDDPSIIPPPGLYQPVRGFGLVWREGHLVRDRLGWAVSPEDSFETGVQRTSYAEYNDIYIQAQDGNVWRLLPEKSGWEKVITSD